MLDGLGLAETTPGPLIMVVQFVGFLAAFRDPGGLDPWAAAVLGATLGHLGDLRAVVPVDLPRGAATSSGCAAMPALDGALAAITAAVVGVILNLAVWFALHVVFGRGQDLAAASAFRLDLPVPASLDPAALVLTSARSWRSFRLRLGMRAASRRLGALGLGPAAGCEVAELAGAAAPLFPSDLVGKGAALGERILNGLAWVVALACVAPIAAAALAALAGDLATWRGLVATVLPGYVRNTLLLVALVAAGTAAIGTGAAWLVTMYRFPGVADLRGGAGAAAGLSGLRARLCLHRLPVASRPGADARCAR